MLVSFLTNILFSECHSSLEKSKSLNKKPSLLKIIVYKFKDASKLLKSRNTLDYETIQGKGT